MSSRKRGTQPAESTSGTPEPKLTPCTPKVGRLSSGRSTVQMFRSHTLTALSSLTTLRTKFSRMSSLVFMRSCSHHQRRRLTPGGPRLSGCDDSVEAAEPVLRVRPVREDDVRHALAARLELPPQHVPVPAALEEGRRFVARYFPGDLRNPAGQRESQHDAALGRLGVFYERPPQLLGRAGNQPFDPHDVLHHLSLSGIYGLP